MAKAGTEYITIDDRSIPVHIFFEWRNNARISIGKKGLNLRLPKVLGPARLSKYLSWCKDWTDSQLKKDPKFKARLFRRRYQDGDSITVGKKSFQIEINYEDRKTHVAKLEYEKIIISLNKNDDQDHIQEVIRKLLSRVISADSLSEIKNRVERINQKWFKEKIGTIRLKYNQSNWGSCSAKKNINLSSRLLFAPTEVIDYVIIHELAHLKELNHSKKFWSIVKSVMPEYRDYEIWLKRNGHLCDF